MTEPTTPDYWTTIADDLVQIADRIRALAGTPTPPAFAPYLSIYSNYVADDADRSVPVVDGLAAAFGATAVTKTEGRGATRQTERTVKVNFGTAPVRIAAAARMPNPPTRAEKLRSRAELETEAAELRAEVAALRAQQAGGAS